MNSETTIDSPDHLIVPFAASSADGWAQAMQDLPPKSLPNLKKLLRGMTLANTNPGDARALSTPHERVLAADFGLNQSNGAEAAMDGLIPWAAFEAQAPVGQAWAIVTPCHWAMGREHATLTDPAALNLPTAQSHALMAAMQPYFETEGITLHHHAPGHWLAEGEVFRRLPTASLDRVLGRNVDAWLPDSTTAPSLRRLQNEMQMLLYTHPLNDERAAARQMTVNSFWLSGTGALSAAAPPVNTTVSMPRQLAQAAFTDDWAAYRAAWQALDAGAVATLLARQAAGQTVRLTLCGERNAQTFETAAGGFLAKIGRFSGLLARWSPYSLLSML